MSRSLLFNHSQESSKVISTFPPYMFQQDYALKTDLLCCYAIISQGALSIRPVRVDMEQVTSSLYNSLKLARLSSRRHKPQDLPNNVGDAYRQRFEQVYLE